MTVFVEEALVSNFIWSGRVHVQEGGLSVSPHAATIMSINDKLLHESVCISLKKIGRKEVCCCVLFIVFILDKKKVNCSRSSFDAALMMIMNVNVYDISVVINIKVEVVLHCLWLA